MAGECVLWTGGIDNTGYGYLYAEGTKRAAHRAALSRKLGRPIAPGMEALHSCDVKACVNPDHLREGTHAENMREAAERGIARPGRANVAACPQGHPMTGDNVMLGSRKGQHGVTYTTRSCRECNRLYLARRRANRKQETA